MFKITFPRALIISFLWHIFCIFAVVIVISPIVIKIENFPKINFIGSILDKETSAYYKQRKGSSYDYKEPDAPMHSFSERLRYAVSAASKTKLPAASIAEIIQEEKESPADFPMFIKELASASAPEIKEQLQGRDVIYKPPKPLISRAFQIGKTPLKGEKFEIKLKFLISPSGKVIFIEKVKSCGYPDIDLIAIRHLENWQFAPLESDKPQKNQEGIMMLTLEAQ